MRDAGLKVFGRRLEDAEFVQSLKVKLAEETAEVAAATSADEVLGELADVMEVVLTLADAHGFTLADLEAARRSKFEERGGFAARVCNASVDGEQSCPATAYYVARPEKYPRL